jgi:photosystem II stability/assembly factor-like uncharacterized protein
MTRRNLGHALLAVALLGVHTGVALAARWNDTSSGLPLGEVAAVSTLVVDPQTSSTLYVLTLSGSVYKSTDGGESWKALSSIAFVRVLAVDPTSASTIYAGTWEGVLKSTNGGESWRFAGLPDRSVGSLAVDQLTPSTIYATAATYGNADTQMFKSTDGGDRWTALSLGFPAEPPFSGIAAVALDPLTPSTIYVLAGRVAFALYKSTDAGESWSVIDAGPFYYSLLVIDPMSPSTLYAIRFGAGLSKSTDGGASWTATGFTKTSGPLTVDPTNSNILYAATAGPSRSSEVTYKSVDGGWNWNALSPSFPTGRLVIDPGKSSTFYAINSNGGLFKSTDAGAHWTGINQGRRVLEIRRLVGSPADPSTIYAGGDGLFKSIDGGGNWQRLSLPPSPTSQLFNESAGVRSLLIHPTDPNILYVVANVRTGGCSNYENVLFRTTDGGATWNNSISPKYSGCTFAGLMGMDPTDPDILYFRGDVETYDELLKSTDRGESWNYTGLFQAAVDTLNVLAIDPTSPATLFAGTRKGVFQSTDGGGNWNLNGLATKNVNLLAIDPLRPHVVYASAAGLGWSAGFRGLFKSTDSGANWSPINNGLTEVLDTRAPVNALILDPEHTDTLYLGTSGYGVFKSTDAGASWTPFNDGMANLDVRVLTLMRNGDATVYAGTPGGVFKILEDGK